MIHQTIHLKEYFGVLGNTGKDPTVEMFLPYAAKWLHPDNHKRPCMILCPGGGYTFQSDLESEPVALKFLHQGFNVFIIRYSVSPHRFPAQLCEVAAVIELIHQNADEWNCNTDKIAMIGFSAGGHLAAHYSTMFDCKEVRDVFPKSKNVNAVILCYPVITAREEYANMDSFENLLGHKPTGDEVEKFSCECNVTTTTPPTFIMHTFEDQAVPVENSLLYAMALRKKNVPCEMHIYPYGLHGITTCDWQTHVTVTDTLEYNSSWNDSVKQWLKMIFQL